MQAVVPGDAARVEPEAAGQAFRAALVAEAEGMAVGLLSYRRAKRLTR